MTCIFLAGNGNLQSGQPYVFAGGTFWSDSPTVRSDLGVTFQKSWSGLCTVFFPEASSKSRHLPSEFHWGRFLSISRPHGISMISSSKWHALFLLETGIFSRPHGISMILSLKWHAHFKLETGILSRPHGISMLQRWHSPCFWLRPLF